MPRAKKTMSGAPGQGVQAIQGQTYGEGVAQERLQQAMPAPNGEVPMATSRPATPNDPPPTPQAPQTERPRMSIDDVQKMVSGLGGTLTAPDDQPNVPFTQGLTSSPGIPNSFSPATNRHRSKQMMYRLSEITGDPIFADLAEKSGY